MSAETVDRLNAALAGRYRVERQLGQGGMATVYLAVDEKHDRKVALKVLKPELVAAVGAARFLSEIKLTARLQHPHILPLHDSGESDGILHYVMPYAAGESLRERMEREKRLPIDEAVAITRAVASALDHAHRQGIVHRDIKPENILLHDGEAVVADFGIALAISAAEPGRMTEEGISIGTPMYMSPEQATGGSVDGRTDIYSLACVLYEMLAGQRPHHETSLQSLIARLLTERPVRVRHLRETVSEELDGVIMKALAKVPADRYASADLFADALADAMAPRVRPRSFAPATATAASVAIVAVGISGYALLKESPSASTVPVQQSQLTFDGNVQDVALAPAGDFFAYFTLQDDARRLYVQEVGSPNPILLDSLNDFACCPAWSPDGAHIAYQRGARGAGSTVVVPRLGGSRRHLEAEVASSWAPDGARLLSWWPAARELTITDVRTGRIEARVPLGESHTWVNAADWSPDGRRLVVALQDSIRHRIRTLTLDGTNVADLVVDTAALGSPVWAAPGRTVYYLRHEEIWEAPVSEEGRPTGVQRLVVPGAGARAANRTVPAISVSDDGRRLLYSRFSGHANLWRFTVPSQPGSEPSVRQPLTRGTASRLLPRLSPDGTLVAFTEGPPGRENLHVMPSAGGPSRQLTFFEGGVWSPAWSPDGSTVAVAASEGGVAGLWLVDAGRGTMQRAEIDPFEGDEIVWWPSAEIVYQHTSHKELRAFDPATSSERLLVSSREPGWWYDLRVSADGRELLARRTAGRDGLWSIDLSTGDARALRSGALAPVAGLADGTVLAMAVDGRTYLAREILIVGSALAGFEPRLVMPMGQAVNSLQVTMPASGEFLIASVPVSSTDLWLVEGIDPR